VNLAVGHPTPSLLPHAELAAAAEAAAAQLRAGPTGFHLGYGRIAGERPVTEALAAWLTGRGGGRGCAVRADRLFVTGGVSPFVAVLDVRQGEELFLGVEDVFGDADKADGLVLLDVLGLERDEGSFEHFVGKSVLTERIHHVENPGELERVEDTQAIRLVVLRVGVLLYPPVAFLLLETDGAPKEL
jgi:hypothetical protein